MARNYDLEDLLGKSVGDMTKSDVLPEGVLHVRVAKAEVREPSEERVAQAEKEGKDAFPYVNWDYVVTGSSPEELHGRHVWEIGSLKPGGDFVNRGVLEALGFGEDVSLRDALEAINGGEYELLIAVTVDGKWNEKDKKWEGQKGKDGKFYEPRNKVTKRMPLAS